MRSTILAATARQSIGFDCASAVDAMSATVASGSLTRMKFDSR
jgi:hypothetical protein